MTPKQEALMKIGAIAGSPLNIPELIRDLAIDLENYIRLNWPETVAPKLVVAPKSVAPAAPAVAPKPVAQVVAPKPVAQAPVTPVRK
jgi:hypothetical protein